ncbi:MAG: IS1634 family transposase, partial [Actinobacteria bacterium]|nr:IS1634 family transposase [Actinomycetota bacterium]
EGSVTISEKVYRAVVVHSDANDARRQKRIERELSESLREAKEMLEDAGKTEYYCLKDAQAAADRLRSSGSRLHTCDCTVAEKVTYSRGRPPKSGPRKVSRTTWVLEGKVVEKTDDTDRLREIAGCFVLITNVPSEEEMAHTASEILAAYKEQHGIERNFGFLKDPVIVNDIFLKRPDRIEVLGFILLVSLLVWRLMEHVMRSYIEKNDSTIAGWDDRRTRKPTAFMMTIMFKGLLVVERNGQWHFPKPLSGEQKEYVAALGLSEELLLGRGDGARDQKLRGGRR